MSDPLKNSLKPETRAAQALGWEDRETGAVVPPIHLSTTFARDPSYALPDGRSYARDETPAVVQAETLLAGLENGSHALLFSSGLAACTAAFQCLSSGDHVIAPDSMYHGLLVWLRSFPPAWGIDVSFVKPGDIGALEEALIPGRTRIVWIETPSNPVWTVTDISAAAEACHRAGASLIVDSTSATPALSRPLDLGADIVCHAATKYLNGHSDVLAGALVTREGGDLWDRIREHRQLAGPVLGPLEAYLLLRGMKTLYVRMEKHCRNAEAVAAFLKSHKNVTAVRYPGLADHPGHEIAARQMPGGFGGMLSFDVAGGADGALKTCAGLQVIKRATSLGGVESLIEHRYSIEPPETQVPPALLRLSVGIEAAEDLIEDLDRALSAL